ncbi:hypothetical protein L226DRAFT_528866 [Lentinus tigrinus ALCF2SS1-7]|nr:hypothetical protein L226DRAFT_528866 [Lentinus tigrinus ALCF2SS1-7]
MDVPVSVATNVPMSQVPSFGSADTDPSATATVVEDAWKLPNNEELREELLQRYSESEKAAAWVRSAETVKTYNDELVTRWKEEMDTLLVYAGLFSAVLTAFNVQSYQLLQPEPTDPSLAVLKRISAQLNSFSVNPSFVNSTQHPLTDDEINPPFYAPTSAVWINALWFSSLICSLASASIALMVKQWLHELSIGVSGTSRESARIRQYRLNSLKRWRVGSIVIIIPILLQLALFLFLVGLVMLLWTLHGTVAAVATSLVGTLFVFVAITTLLPVLRVDCCYRSPQALGIFMAVREVRKAIRAFRVRLAEGAWSLTKPWKRSDGFLGKAAELTWRLYVTACISKKDLPSWHGREQIVVAKDMNVLDRDLASMAYTTTFDSDYLDVLRPLMADLPWPHAVACYEDIFHARTRLWGASTARTQDRFARHSFDALHVLLTVSGDERDENWQNTVTRVLNNLPLPSDTFEENVLRNLSVLAKDNNPCADKAFLRIIMHLRDHETQDVFESRDGIRAVMIMSEWRARFPGGTDIPTTLRHYLQSIESVVRCALRSISSDLSDDDRQSIRTRVQSTLSSFRGFLRTSLWKEPSLYICLGLSNIVPLLVELVRHDRELVTEELAETLDHVWSAIREDAQDVADGERLRRVQAYIDWTGEVLEALKAVMDGRPVDAGQKSRMKRPRAQFDIVKTSSSPRFASWTRRRPRLPSL